MGPRAIVGELSIAPFLLCVLCVLCGSTLFSPEFIRVYPRPIYRDNEKQIFAPVGESAQMRPPWASTIRRADLRDLETLVAGNLGMAKETAWIGTTV